MTLWQQYRETGDPAIRNRLILTYAPLVKYVVFRKIREMPARYELDDFISCGLEALIQSIDRFDPEKGATLEQFLWTRVHGAVLDELRRLDWAPRSLRTWERDIALATRQFRVLHGRGPTQEELADALALSLEELRAREDDIALCDIGSLNVLVNSDEGTVERLDTVASPHRRLEPETAAELQQAKVRFREAFERLPTRQREIAVLLYVKNLSLKEIGEIYGLSESRVSQIHAQMRRKLRKLLAAEEELLQAVM